MSWGEAEVELKVSRHHCSSLERSPRLSLVSAAGPSPLATFRGAARGRAERGGHMASSTSVSSQWQAAAMAKWPAHGFSATETKCNFLAARLQGTEKRLFCY